MAEDIDWLDLPGRWTYGVDRGGRVFFIKYVAPPLSTCFPVQVGWAVPGVLRPLF